MADDPITCYVCGGDLALLGTLGRLTWLRCIQCGIEQSTTLPVGNEPEEE